MGYIDRQPIFAVGKLPEPGSHHIQVGWQIVHANDLLTEADAMHARLLHRVDARGGRVQGSEEGEPANIAALPGANETERRPVGKISGRNG